MDAVGTVLRSEFFWGMIVGVVLTGIGAWGQAVFTIWQERNGLAPISWRGEVLGSRYLI
jgi:hypothetical protein